VRRTRQLLSPPVAAGRVRAKAILQALVGVVRVNKSKGGCQQMKFNFYHFSVPWSALDQRIPNVAHQRNPLLLHNMIFVAQINKFCLN
jgi:hypothetical protein